MEAVRELLAPEPWEEQNESEPARFLQVVEPLHTMYRLPLWAVTGGEPVNPGVVIVRLALDEEENRETRELLVSRYGEPDSDIGAQLVFYLPNDRPTATELIDLARRPDVVFVGDRTAGGGPAGGGTTSGPTLPDGYDPNVSIDAIPTTSPLALSVLVLVLGLLGWTAVRRR